MTASVWLHNIYSPQDVTGVSILVVASAVSLLAVLAMLIAIIISSFKTDHTFIRSHLGAYFVSLVIAELVQATGSIMSARWVQMRGVELGHFCAAQGALKNAGNVSTALWSMVIAFHTFWLIFLKIRVVPWVFYSTLILTWFIVGFVVLLGPAALQTTSRGPFWGISGYWCWIADNYSLERLTMEYLFMFMAAVLSVILYGLIFLRLRGNINGTGFRVSFCRARTPWQRDNSMSDPQIARVGKRMLWYPLAYVVLILPIAACRWSEIFGSTVPFGVTIFADTVFVLSGLVNAILYSTTRRVVPIKSIIPSRKDTSVDEKAMESFESGPTDVQGPFMPAYPATAYYPTRRNSDSDVVEDYASERMSIEEGGYPGPEVHHAPPRLAVPTPPPDMHLHARSHSGLSRGSEYSRGSAFDQDWI